jgi:hypothetical protein
MQSALLTMGVKTTETCWDTIDWINHYLLHLVGLAFDYLSKIQGQTNLKFMVLEVQNYISLILQTLKLLWQPLYMTFRTDISIPQPK